MVDFQSKILTAYSSIDEELLTQLTQLYCEEDSENAVAFLLKLDRLAGSFKWHVIGLALDYGSTANESRILELLADEEDGNILLIGISFLEKYGSSMSIPLLSKLMHSNFFDIDGRPVASAAKQALSIIDKT